MHMLDWAEIDCKQLKYFAIFSLKPALQVLNLTNNFNMAC
jgi:hypothetical protein